MTSTSVTEDINNGSALQEQPVNGNTSNTASTSNAQGTGGRTVSELPPETLDFAAKVFDLARNGDEQTLRVYLEAGLPANLTNDRGEESMVVAMHITCSSHIGVPCRAGNTLLMLAAYNGHASLVGLLHSKGADPNRLNDRGQSPLAGAIFKGEDEVVTTLVELGADPRAGAPSAIESAKLFGQDKWLDLLGATDEERARPAVPTGIGIM
jgi:hypothetical protein